jgi:hypothetical protein
MARTTAGYDFAVHIRRHIDDPAYDKQEPARIKIGDIQAMSATPMDFHLPLGNYQIDIRSMYYKYTEMHKIFPFDGQIKQTYTITETY